MNEIAFIEPTSQMSGVEFSTLYLAQHLDRSRWHSLVVCPEEGPLTSHCRESGIEVAIIPGVHFFSTSVRFGTRTFPNPIAMAFDVLAVWLVARRLARFLKTRRPAVVVTKGLLAHFYGGLAARWSSIPCIWHVQDRVSERWGPFNAWVMRAASSVLARQVIVDADSIATQLGRNVSGGRISVIWNGVDLDEFSPLKRGPQLRHEWGANQEDVLIGNISRLTPWKGQSTLVNAYARIADRFPRSRLVLIGSALFESDEYAQALKRQAKDCGLNGQIVFAGFRADLPQALGALDIVAHTALEKESSPLAVVSAMAAGKPIVCTRVDGTAELFDENEDGLLVAPGNVDELAQKLCQLLCDSNLRQRLGQAARIKAERQLDVNLFAQRCELVLVSALK
jgi:glycosyltransferase involved in cell wall biosynthesis